MGQAVSTRRHAREMADAQAQLSAAACPPRHAMTAASLATAPAPVPRHAAGEQVRCTAPFALDRALGDWPARWTLQVIA